MKIILSDCQQFLDVHNMKFMASDETNIDDMKFMAIESSEVCDGCHFNMHGCTEYFHSTCIGEYRYDSRDVIWLRIL